jgi:hypothetical protein
MKWSTIMTADPTPAAKINAQEATVKRLRRELEIAEAVLIGMQAMLPDAPKPPMPNGRDKLEDVWRNLPRLWAESPANSKGAPAKGRQPGAISRQWRDTLAMLWMNYPFPEGFTEYNAATAAQSAGLPNVGPKEALERMKAYVNHNYVERLSNGKWRVTDHMAEKYGFSNKCAPSVAIEEAP